MTANLSTHHGTDRITRAQLGNIPTPQRIGPQHQPVPHIELIETLEARLFIKLGASIVHEEFAVRRQQSTLFGVLTINYAQGIALMPASTPTTSAAIGLRHANDMSLSMQLVAGMSVFVCDNMVLRGDMILMRRKHTLDLSLIDEIDIGIDRFVEHYAHLERETQLLRDTVLSDHSAKAFILDAFAKELIMPLNLMRRVYAEYFKPTHAEFEPRTGWSLHNAFTQVAKDLPLTTRVPVVQKLGRLLGLQS